MKVFSRWGDAVEALLEGVDAVECHGRRHTRVDALRSLGYDGAARRGLLDEYKIKVLGQRGA